jgi:hypothetical protein
MNATSAIMETKALYKISDIYYHYRENVDETVNSADNGTIGVYCINLKSENDSVMITQIDFLDGVKVLLAKRTGESHYYSYKWNKPDPSRTVKSLDIDFEFMENNANYDQVRLIGENLCDLDGDDWTDQDIVNEIKNGLYGKCIKINADTTYLPEERLSESQKKEMIEKCIELLKTL